MQLNHSGDSKSGPTDAGRQSETGLVEDRPMPDLAGELVIDRRRCCTGVPFDSVVRDPNCPYDNRTGVNVSFSHDPITASYCFLTTSATRRPTVFCLV